MDVSLYTRHILRTKQSGKTDPLKYAVAAEEAAWFQPDYDRRQQFVAMPFYGTNAGYWKNESLQKTVLEKVDHGDFRSNYPYFTIRYKNTGNNFIGVEERQWDVRQPKTIYTYRGWLLGTVRNATWIGGQSAPHSTAYQKMKSSALIAIGDAILKELPQWDVLTDLAELGETGNLFKDGVSFLYGLSSGILRKNPTTILRAFGVKPTVPRKRHVRRVIRREFAAASSFSEARARTAASLWLTYRYGVMPLLYSFEDAIRAIHTPDAALKRDFQVTFRDRAVIVDRTFVSAGGGNTSAVATFQESVVNEYSYRIRARVDFSTSWAARFGLTPWAIPRVAWELVPFSFVEDWFYDVGGWLQRLDLPNLVASIDLVGTLKDRCQSRLTMSNPRLGSPSSWPIEKRLTTSIVGLTSLSESRCFKRELLTYSAPPPNLEWGLDRFKRQLDAASLMLLKARFR